MLAPPIRTDTVTAAIRTDFMEVSAIRISDITAGFGDGAATDTDLTIGVTDTAIAEGILTGALTGIAADMGIEAADMGIGVATWLVAAATATAPGASMAARADSAAAVSRVADTREDSAEAMAAAEGIANSKLAHATIRSYAGLSSVRLPVCNELLNNLHA